MIRLVLATLLFCLAGAAALNVVALGAEQDKGSAADAIETPGQVFALATHQAIGAPTKFDIDNQATVRLLDDLIIIPQNPASKLLAVANYPILPGFEGLLFGSDGIQTAGLIRFVPVGFVDSDVTLTWSVDDMLASMNDEVQRGNPNRLKNKQQELEARRWVLPPHYNPKTHQLAWAALIVPKSAPPETDGEITYHAIEFGREGYLSLTFVSSVEKAEYISRMINTFLLGLTFVPGKAYADATPTDSRAPGGLAAVMGVGSLHKAGTTTHFLSGDRLIPGAGTGVAAVGALSLLLYIRRHLRRESRRT